MQTDIPFQGSDPLPPAPLHWPSLWQLILSSLAGVAALCIAMLLAALGAVEVIRQSSTWPEITQTFLVAWSAALAGLLSLPSAWYALQRLTRPQPAAPPARPRFAAWKVISILLGVVLPPTLLAGSLVFRLESLTWLVLPPLNILATGLPVLWLVFIGIHGLPTGSRQRAWGVLTAGLTFSPALIMLIEIVALAGFGLVALVIIMANPDASNEMLQLATRLRHTPPNSEIYLRILGPYMVRPAAMLGVLTYTSLLVPFIEELIKPLGVWLLAKRLQTPAEGFAAGLISGAGFALLENLGNTAGSGDQWPVMVSVRITTALLHCLNSGLMGWALVSAWRQGRFLRLGLTFAGVVLLHGAWNTLGIMGVFSSDFPSFIPIPEEYRLLGNLSMIGLPMLTLMNIALYLGVNRSLRGSQPASQAAPPPASPAPAEAEALPAEPVPAILPPPDDGEPSP